MRPSIDSNRRFLLLSPLALAVLYAVLGGGWIIYSDFALLASFGNAQFDRLTHLQTLKGLAYVAVTSLLIWLLLERRRRALAAAEAGLEESEAMRRQVFERLGAVCLVIDGETQRIVDANPAALAYYGWTRDELLAMHTTDLAVASAIDMEAITRRVQAGEQRVFVVEHRLKAGEIREVEVLSTEFRSAGRRMAYVLVLDVTERRRAERALESSERNYRNLLHQANDGVFITTSEGIILEVNARACEMLGCTSSELVGRPLTEINLASDLRQRPLRLDELRSKGTLLIDRILRRKDGSAFAAEVNAQVLADGRLLGVARDVSGRKALEERLRQAQKMEAVGQLTGGIAHDLNNILTVVLANAELLAKGLPEDQPDSRADLEDLRSAARRGAAMIEKLLGFSRHAPLSVTTLDLGRLVADLLPTLRRLLPATIAVETGLPQQTVWVRADAGSVEQILLNLATNARDAMPDGGRLWIEVEPGGRVSGPGIDPARRYACLRVTDTGVGMDEDTRARVFEPFFTTKPSGQGSGLGLSMVYGLVQQHRGSVQLDSAPGAGARVAVYLPTADSEDPGEAPASGSRPALSVRGGTETLLLVEDEEPVRRATQRVLERYGYTVLTAADGREAVQALATLEPSIALVITDLVMPKMGGRELFEATRRAGMHVRFLFASGYAPTELRETSRPHGPEHFIQKPWTVEALALRVREILDSPVNSSA
jgi:PAS domain S-box-containing protein